MKLGLCPQDFIPLENEAPGQNDYALTQEHGISAPPDSGKLIQVDFISLDWHLDPGLRPRSFAGLPRYDPPLNQDPLLRDEENFPSVIDPLSSSQRLAINPGL